MTPEYQALTNLANRQAQGQIRPSLQLCLTRDTVMAMDVPATIAGGCWNLDIGRCSVAVRIVNKPEYQSPTFMAELNNIVADSFPEKAGEYGMEWRNRMMDKTKLQLIDIIVDLAKKMRDNHKQP